jgi:hypothetical protein
MPNVKEHKPLKTSKNNPPEKSTIQITRNVNRNTNHKKDQQHNPPEKSTTNHTKRKQH